MKLEDARQDLLWLGADLKAGPGCIRLDTSGPIAELVIDHPAARNALTLQMMVQLCEAVMALRSWDGAALILRSADPLAFCSGGHLKQVQRALFTPEAGRRMARAMGAVLDALLGLPLVSVSVLDGIAMGGGAEVCTATDARVMSPRARIYFVHARLGVAPGWGGSARLVQHIGRGPALRVLTTASPLDADRALALGLADVVADDPLAATHDWLAPVLQLPAPAVRAAKAQVAGGDAADWFATVWGGPDHRAALAAVGKKRR